MPTEISKVIESKIDVIGKDIVEVCEDVKALRHTIEGNGQPGMKIRLDRLEQNAERAKWLARLALGASISAIITAISKLIIVG